MVPMNRRELLQTLGSLAAVSVMDTAIPVQSLAGPKSPTSPVSLGRCTTYELPEVMKQLDAMFDQLGGVKKLVAGKTVVLKVNLTGNSKNPALGRPANRTYQTHPSIALATAMLLDRAGAKRLRFVDCTYQSGPIEDVLVAGGWDLKAFEALKADVDFEDTRNLGKGKRYTQVKVPWGGSLYPAYELNHSYVDCDVYMSLAKLKNHYTAGVTLGIKNNFGITPTALYGQPEQNERSTNARVQMFHEGATRPMAGLPQEVDPNSPRVTSYRVPRHTVDALGIRPIDLTIIDGIETTSGGEGPWIQGIEYHKPDLLVAGRNPVCTDAIATAAMGYDPLAASGTGPFPGDNHLKMAMDLGLGSADPKKIEVRGLSLKEATHPFNWLPAKRGY